MTPSPNSRAPLVGAASRVPALALLLAAAVLAGCEVDWGGARLELRDPSPPDTAGASGSGGGERPEPVPDLPAGPLLYVAALDDAGRARAAPAARLTPGGPESVSWPDDPPPVYLERFGRTFQPPGAQLPLLADGGRVGMLMLGERRTPVDGGCPPVAAGQALLPPGRPAPGIAFATSPADGAGEPEAAPAPVETRRHRVFAPILAERILREAGVERPFLARRVDLRPVAFPGDTTPGLAATFVIRDSLSTAPPPSGPSTALFFLARYEPAEGFVPVWSRIRSYESGADKEVLTHLGWIRASGGPLHLVRRITTGGVRLAAFRPGGAGDAAGAGELTWVASGGCRALEAVERPTPEPAGGGGPEAAASDTAP